MTFRDEIRETVSPHKFGGSREAAMLYLLSLDSGQDEQTGTVEWDVWVARFGRRLLIEDAYGFAYSRRYPTVDAARETFDEIDRSYSAWDEQDG